MAVITYLIGGSLQSFLGWLRKIMKVNLVIFMFSELVVSSNVVL